MFPSDQDIKTYRSVVAKKKKREAERDKVSTPTALCQAILDSARSEFRRGKTKLSIQPRLPINNFLEWANTRANFKGHLSPAGQFQVLELVRRETRQLLFQEFRPESKIFLSKFNTRVVSDGLGEFDIVLQITIPDPH